jgi:hypothetical protein
MNPKDFLIQQLTNGPAVLSDLIAAIPSERLDHQFGNGIWSVHDHVQHLAFTQVLMAKRVQMFFKEERPEIIPYYPDKDAARPALKPVPELLASYADSIWRKKAIHPEYTEYDFHIAVRHILTHDGFHFYRIEELGFLKPENVKPM